MCRGDSGGPLIWDHTNKNVVTGIMSAVQTSGWVGLYWRENDPPNCAILGGYEKWTRMSSKVEWIRGISDFVDQTYNSSKAQCREEVIWNINQMICY